MMELDHGQRSGALPHGQKRSPDDELESDQPLAKRFNLLNLENANKLYIQVGDRPPALQRKRSNAVTIDNMNVDETKNRVYIHDLDAEIADMESEEEKLVFLPDIEKRLAKIPKSVLLGKQPENAPNEVILYGVPESLSIPQDKDVVRKAIIESRARARERHSHSEDEIVNLGSSRTRNGFSTQPPAQALPVNHSYNMDEDAMDMG